MCASQVRAVTQNPSADEVPYTLTSAPAKSSQPMPALFHRGDRSAIDTPQMALTMRTSEARMLSVMDMCPPRKHQRPQDENRSRTQGTQVSCRRAAVLRRSTANGFAPTAVRSPIPQLEHQALRPSPTRCLLQTIRKRLSPTTPKGHEPEIAHQRIAAGPVHGLDG